MERVLWSSRTINKRDQRTGSTTFIKGSVYFEQITFLAFKHCLKAPFWLFAKQTPQTKVNANLPGT